MQNIDHHRQPSDTISSSISCPNFRSMDHSFIPNSSWNLSSITASSTRQHFIESSEFPDSSYYSQTPTKEVRRNSSMGELHSMSTTAPDIFYDSQDMDFSFADSYYQDSFTDYQVPSLPTSSNDSFVYHGHYHSTPMSDMSSNYNSSFDSQLPYNGGCADSGDTYAMHPEAHNFGLDSGYVYSSQASKDHSVSGTPVRRTLPPSYLGSASSSISQSSGDRLEYFMSPSPGAETDQDSPFTTPSKCSTPSQRNFPGLETSLSLQRVQSEPAVERKTANKKYPLPDNLSVQKQAKRCCPWPGCQGRFQRQEHLKRHMKTHRNEIKLPCQFCGKVFGRADNLKSHIRLHMHPKKKSSRTDFFPGARRVYEEMSRKTRTMGNIQFVHEMIR
ncbi:hypothetical protein PVAG01_03480 [Phlyctema vagabunda]|uniref:C2H2-type domain-containing protein n=1 Tax=Phlyctema vagabunda TaxID=108571 RepID=A0ABR4PLM1_9HELO